MQVTLIRDGQARPGQVPGLRTSSELDGVDGAIVVSAVGASFQLAAASESILMNARVRTCVRGIGYGPSTEHGVTDGW